MILRSTILALALAGASLWAQPGRGPAPVRSPEVSAGGKVTFRLRAPNAKEVAVTSNPPGPFWGGMLYGLPSHVG